MSETEIETATKAVEDVIRATAWKQGLDLQKSAGTYGLGTDNGLSLDEVAAKVGIEVVYSDNGVPSIHHSTEWRG